MKRRDIFSIIPLGLLGLNHTASKAAPFKKRSHKLRKVDGAPLPLTYTKKVTNMLKWVRATQSEKILEGAYAIARTIESGGKCWCNWDLGHTSSSDIFPDRNGKPEFLIPGYDFDKVRDGDIVLASYPGPAGYIENLGKRDLFVIGGPCPWGGDVRGQEHIREDIQKLKILPNADIWIETNIDNIGAQVKIPGSAAPLGPESGPLSGTIFWMMVSDACRILALKGKSVKVSGDEPELSGDNVPWVDMADPLMDNYFDDVLRQMELIGSELGNIRKIANMAVDTLLSGGNVYFYSRYSVSFANEASGRRGGFAFARGLSDGRIQGTSKDCVIMGTYEPDDEADLKNLDLFKKRGMRVASVGPITRDMKIPEGRTVFRETEAHVGRMIDTYGVFAIKGIERKISPTSGILAITILWEISTELAMEIIRRTGNTPGIHFNGALKWAGSYNSRVRAMALERGY